MSGMRIEISPRLEERIKDWSVQMKRPAESLAVELLEEYFDDCDDAMRLENLIRSGKMETYPAQEVHAELGDI